MAEGITPTTAAIVRQRRDNAATPYNEETRTRCFVLFATFGARNCAATARLYAEEARGLGLPTPDRATVARWAADERWHEQADNLWRQTKGRSTYELQILFTANTMLSQKALHAILTGEDERALEERIVTLKAIETAMRSRERLPELARVDPPDQAPNTDGQTREEREANAMAGIARGRRRHG